MSRLAQRVLAAALVAAFVVTLAPARAAERGFEGARVSPPRAAHLFDGALRAAVAFRGWLAGVWGFDNASASSSDTTPPPPPPPPPPAGGHNGGDNPGEGIGLDPHGRPTN